MKIEDFCSVTTNFYYKRPENLSSILSGGNEMQNSIKKASTRLSVLPTVILYASKR